MPCCHLRLRRYTRSVWLPFWMRVCWKTFDRPPIAIHNAVKLVISTNIHIQGCFYHLTQSTWRRVQAEGLQASYKDDEEVRNFCGMLDALAGVSDCHPGCVCAERRSTDPQSHRGGLWDSHPQRCEVSDFDQHPHTRLLLPPDPVDVETSTGGGTTGQLQGRWGS